MPSLHSVFTLLTILTCEAFVLRPPAGGLRTQLRMLSAPPAPEGTAHTLVLLRHGESTWNEDNRFTGWYDCPLSERGLNEALESGALLRADNYKFDIAFTSLLKRAIKTLWVALESLDLMYIPVIHSWRLNERHYGGLQGLDKKETVAKHGKEQVQVWRRSYDIPPPPAASDSEHYPGNDVKYRDVPREDLPFTESLKDTEARVMVEWRSQIMPQILANKKVLIAAHGNTLRALVKYLDDIPADVITELNIPTGVPLVYHLDSNLKPIKNPLAIAPLSGAYLGDQDQIRARILGVVNQTK